jgi:hypothetical protein
MLPQPPTSVSWYSNSGSELLSVLLPASIDIYQQYQADDIQNCSKKSVLNAPAHEAARQNVNSLQDPNDAN